MQDKTENPDIPLNPYSQDHHEMTPIEPMPLSRESLDKKPSFDSSSSSSSSASESAEGLPYDARELEAQQQPDPAPEHQTSTRKKIIFVALYFFLNLTLTLTNKSVLNHVSESPFAATGLKHPY
jgi:hypothetical protein